MNKTQHDNAEARRQYVMARVQIECNGCWTWTGGRAGDGYGDANFQGKRQGAHRFSYEAWNGPLALGMHAGHKHGCATPTCVNPEHLEPQSPSANSLEQVSRRHERRKRTPQDRAHAKADVLYGHGGYHAKAVRNGMSRTMARLIAKGVLWLDVPATSQEAA